MTKEKDVDDALRISNIIANIDNISSVLASNKFAGLGEHTAAWVRSSVEILASLISTGFSIKGLIELNKLKKADGSKSTDSDNRKTIFWLLIASNVLSIAGGALLIWDILLQDKKTYTEKNDQESDRALFGLSTTFTMASKLMVPFVSSFFMKATDNKSVNDQQLIQAQSAQPANSAA